MDIPGDEPDLDAQIAQAQSEIASGAVVTAVDRLQALIEVPIYDHRLHYAMAAALGAACWRMEQAILSSDEEEEFHRGDAEDTEEEEEVGESGEKN